MLLSAAHRGLAWEASGRGEEEEAAAAEVVGAATVGILVEMAVALEVGAEAAGLAMAVVCRLWRQWLTGETVADSIDLVT